MVQLSNVSIQKFTDSSNILNHTMSEKTLDDLVVLVLPYKLLQIHTTGMTVHVDQHTLNQWIVEFHDAVSYS